MCRSGEAYHQHSHCRLTQSASDSAPSSDSDQPEPGFFTLLSQLLRRRASAALDPDGGGAATTKEEEPDPVYPEPHTIKIVFIVKCESAENDESLHPDKGKRRCLELQSFADEGESVVDERPRLTTMNKTCPVCEAIERAEQQALVQEIIVSLFLGLLCRCSSRICLMLKPSLQVPAEYHERKEIGPRKAQ